MDGDVVDLVELLSYREYRWKTEDRPFETGKREDIRIVG
jgi:hypothetical protein